MSILSDNLRYLRAQKNYSQLQVANKLVIGRGRYAKYEDAKSEPPLYLMQRISYFFQVSIDLLIAVDLIDVPEEERRLQFMDTLKKYPEISLPHIAACATEEVAL